MIQKTVTLTNPTGLHARPASLIVALAQKFESKITLQCGERAIDARSIMSILSGGIKNGSEVTIVCDGPDEVLALTAVAEFIEQLSE